MKEENNMAKKWWLRMVIFSIVILWSINAFAYTNPLTLSSEWSNYGIGDPFVMKFNGTYYLYCSTLDNQTGVKCWTSTDLVNWTYYGLCSSDSITKTAYAPEVVYWNGTFYMYTSPGGGGHYVLSSNSPTGPFNAVTGNLGHSIDGDVFIDDNGSWYFFNAGSDGIHGSLMSGPTIIGSDAVLGGTQISGQWTEGPTVFKRNGMYYITDTGNHVLSPGYRVYQETNTSGPLQSYTPSNFNPALLNSEGSVVGLGHNSILTGPDLDTYYTVYHNLTGVVAQGWPLRKLNFDAVGWNGDKMVVYGPTSWSMSNPAAPTFEDRFQRTSIGTGYSNNMGGAWSISNNFLCQNTTGSTQFFAEYENTFTTASDYTAEFNVQETSRGTLGPKCGSVYGYTNSQNYGFAALDGINNQLQTNLYVGGVWGTQVNTPLPAGFDITKIHTIRIEKSGSTYKYFVDKMLLETRANAGLGAGYVGYMSCDDAAKFGYIAVSNKVNGSGIFDFYKPIPGTIQAVHYNSGGEGVGYHDTSSGNTGGKYIRNDNVDIRDCPEGGENIGWNSTGEWYKYNVSVAANGTYNLGIRYATTYTGCQVRVWFDSTDVTGVVNLPSTGGWDNWQTYTIKGLNLTAGTHTITVETVTGEYDFYTLKFVQADNSSFTKTDNFDTAFSSDWNYSDGNWSIVNGTANINNVGKRTIGNTGWSDYSVECDVEGTDTLNTGIMVRVQNPAQGGAGNDPGLGSDFYQGYLACLSTNGVSLGKQNYDWMTLATSSGTYNLNTWYHMKVVIGGNEIKVYVGDMNNALIDYIDNSNPFINGKAGIRSHYANSYFDNFSVTH
jgi:xylan 1,4-beta-xylosidase